MGNVTFSSGHVESRQCVRCLHTVQRALGPLLGAQEEDLRGQRLGTMCTEVGTEVRGADRVTREAEGGEELALESRKGVDLPGETQIKGP